MIIYTFGQNPAGGDKGNEWVTLYNPLNASVDIGNWTLETADGEGETIPEGTTFIPSLITSISCPISGWITARVNLNSV